MFAWVMKMNGKKKSKQFPKSPANMRLCNCKFTARLNVWTFFSKLKYAFYWLNEMLHFSGPIKIYSHIFFGGKYARNRNAYCWCCFCCCKPKIVAKCNCSMYLRVSSPVSFHFISFAVVMLRCFLCVCSSLSPRYWKQIYVLRMESVIISLSFFYSLRSISFVAKICDWWWLLLL